MTAQERDQLEQTLRDILPFETSGVVAILDRCRMRSEEDFHEAVGIIINHVAWSNQAKGV